MRFGDLTGEQGGIEHRRGELIGSVSLEQADSHDGCPLPAKVNHQAMRTMRMLEFEAKGCPIDGRRFAMRLAESKFNRCPIERGEPTQFDRRIRVAMAGDTPLFFAIVGTKMIDQNRR